MGQINLTELESMLYLLDDSDVRVVEHIEAQILDLGAAVIPLLDERWPQEANYQRQHKILSLIKIIQQQSLSTDLRLWSKTKEQDLLDGLLIINKLKDKTLTRQPIDNLLDKLKLDAWLEMHYDLTSFEKVKILNHIFLMFMILKEIQSRIIKVIIHSLVLFWSEKEAILLPWQLFTRS